VSDTDYRELARETRARAEAAHKGPWHIHEGDLVDANHQDVFVDWEEAYGPNEDEVGPDTAFICAAQEDVIALADAIDAQAREIKRLRAALTRVKGYSEYGGCVGKDTLWEYLDSIGCIASEALKGE
jgi:hypothetical protein